MCAADVDGASRHSYCPPVTLRIFDGPRGEYTLRFATLEDASILAHHRAAMFHDMGDVDEQAASIIENASIDQLTALMEAREYFGFLAEFEGEVVAGGGAWLRPLLPRPGTLYASIEAYVLNVYVEAEHRRGGVARTLMKTIIDWSREQKVARVVLHASREGRPLYEELGFELSNEYRLKLTDAG